MATKKLKKMSLKKPAIISTSLLVMMVGLSACNAGQRIAEIGSVPAMSEIENPAKMAGATPIAFPQPAKEEYTHQANSLWQAGARQFFKDQRAQKVGDILTVVIQVSDKASITNETKRSRNTSEKDSINNLLGYETKLGKILPEEVVPSTIADFGGKTQNDGKGEISREEKINLRVAAVVTQVMPNGNLVLAGKQEMTVNYELRELRVTGVIRPEDISSQNSINYDQIAEARIAYGGRGQVMEVQQARYGTQLFDIIFPF
jgi:flagellar L-ring protein precursor FlgH